MSCLSVSEHKEFTSGAVNFFADPYAVKEALTPSEPQKGLPLERFLLLPLDVTTPHQLPFPYYTAHVDPTFVSTAVPSKSQDKSPLTHFTSSFLERTREIMLEFGCDGMELHDIVAVWCAIENPPVLREDKDGLPVLKPGWEAVKRKFEIERSVLTYIIFAALSHPSLQDW
jgi:hypothetical protein